MYWVCVEKYPVLLQIENTVSYDTINKIYAIIKMKEDYRVAYEQMEYEEMQKLNNNG